VRTALNAIHKISNDLYMRQWKRAHPDFLVVFNWHQITPSFDPLLHHEYTWSQLDDFERELSLLAAEFRVLPLHKGIKLIERHELRGPCAALTFDDGDVSMQEHVLPLLRKHGLPATFFINSAYLDGCGSYWFPILNWLLLNPDAWRGNGLPREFESHALKLRQTSDPMFYGEWRTRIEQLAPLVPNLGARLVSSDWLDSLDGDQFAIGAHGHEHERFSMMPKEWQLNDLTNNVKFLSKFRSYRPIFAVPFGRGQDWTEETLCIARDSGLDVVLADGGINVSTSYKYRRIPSDSRKLAPLVSAAIAGTRSPWPFVPRFRKFLRSKRDAGPK